MDFNEAKRRVHEAIGGLLDDDELAVGWCLTIDVAGTDGRRYLAHRAGGGADGGDNPMMWTALGMLQASVDVARAQLAESVSDYDPDDDED